MVEYKSVSRPANDDIFRLLTLAVHNDGQQLQVLSPVDMCDQGV